MKLFHLFAYAISMLAGAAPLVHAATPVHVWSQRFGAVSWDQARAIAVDGLGNVVVVGSFQGAVNFGGGNLVSAGDRDIFIARYSPTGTHLWSKRFGSTGYDEANAVAVDMTGSLVVTGVFAGTVNFGGGNLVSAGDPDIFLVKFSAAGGHTWSKRFGSTGYDEGLGVAVDLSGYVYTTGAFEGSVSFGDYFPIVSAGYQDIYVAGFGSDGYAYTSQRFGAGATDRGEAIAVDRFNKVVITGTCAGTVNFGGGDLVTSGYDLFVAKFNAGFTHIWSKRFGDTGQDKGTAIATDASGNVVVAGQFQNVIDFGGGQFTANNNEDMFLVEFDPSGAHRWSLGLGGSVYEEARSVAVDASGDVLFTGFFHDTMDFGGGNLTSAGSADIFLARYAPNGKHRWSGRFGYTSYDYGMGVAVDASQKILLAGLFMGTVDFGGGGLGSAGSADILMAKFGPDPPAPGVSSIADVPNDQGRTVKIRFRRSGFDATDSAHPISAYEAYRRDDAPPAAPVVQASDALTSRHELLADGWSFVGSVPAHAEADYAINAPTIGDSTLSLGLYRSVFFVRAATANPGVFYDSPADSGWSVDNLAPGVPGGVLYSTGRLLWNDPTDEDFDYFTVYGASTNDFGAATLVNHSVMARMDVSASPYVFYFITATDFSGNEGKPAMLNTLSGTGETPKSYVLSISSYPNPFNPETTIRYTVPSKGRVSVEIYDARGAHVATLVDEEQSAGAYTRAWAGRDDGGRAVSSGVYFARVSHPAGVKSYKMVLLK